MKKVTADDLMNEQRKRYLRMKQKEEENRTTAAAKAGFYREPYMGIYKKPDTGESRKSRG